MTKVDDHRDYRVRSLKFAEDVLEAFGFSGDELGVTQIAERLKLTKSSVYRRLQGGARLSLAEFDNDPVTTRWLLGRLRTKTHMMELADEPMRELHNTIKQTVCPARTLSFKQQIGVRPENGLALSYQRLREENHDWGYDRIKQIARNLTTAACGALGDGRYLPHDRDSKYTQFFSGNFCVRPSQTSSAMCAQPEPECLCGALGQA